MGASLAPLLGTDALGSLALTLLTSSKEQSTCNGYLSELNHFFNFCRIESIMPLDVTAAQIVRYIAYLTSLNTIAAGSMQPYLSAINRYLQDHQR
jgi:site-specific recombinase XerD